MVADYDPDRHIQRVLEREQRRPRRRRPQVEQLELFEMPKLDSRPAVPRGTIEGLIVDDEMLFSRLVSLHSATKAAVARTYAEIVGTAMGGRWKIWWVELFSGPGRLFVRESGVFVLGSPLEAMGIPHPFDGYVFTDLNPACTESLRRRVGLAPNIHVLRGDANGAELLDRVTGIVPRNALVVVYADPEGLDLAWPTLKHFIDRYRHLDLLLNLPVTGIVRAISAGYENKARAVLDCPSPRDLIETNGPKGALIREWYSRKLHAEGFDKIHGTTVTQHGRDRELYDVLLASRHPLAQKFFEAAVDSAYKRIAS